MPKAVIEDEEEALFEDDRDDSIDASGDDEELDVEDEEAEEDEAPVAKKKASKPAKVSSKSSDEDEIEISAPKKAIAKAAIKKAASDEDAAERPKSKGKEVKKMANKQKEKVHRSTKRGPILAGYFSKPKTLHATYHGKTLKATVSPDGVIKFNGDTFTSPSGAGSSIRKGKSKVDGWHFWKIQNAKGELVALDSLRQKKSA